MFVKPRFAKGLKRILGDPARGEEVKVKDNHEVFRL
jgi:hypothetical protein